MNRSAHNLLKGTKKRHFIWLFLIFFSNAVFAQLAEPQALDTVALARADSIRVRAEVQDSLAKEYIFVHETWSDPMLDSLRANIIVEGNDFMAWIAFTNSLREKQGFEKELAVSKNYRPTWIIVVLAFLLIGIGLIRIFFATIFRNIVFAYYDKQTLFNMNKEDSLITSWPYIFLFILFSFSLALFVLVVNSRFVDVSVLTLENLLKVSAFVAMLFAGKVLIIRMFASIFEIQKNVREYVVLVYLVYFNSMLILVPFLVFITFSPVVYFNFLLILFSIIVSVLFLYRFFIAAVHMLGQLKFSIFYLILYLCSLEIAPILILVKTLNN